MAPEEPFERSDRDEPDAERRKVVERILPELIKRVIDAGVEKIVEGPENLRHFVSEMRLPKEIGSHVLTQIEETKNGLYRVVAKEIRDFLEHTNLAEELTKALTKMSFEIRTEIRFVPTEDPQRGLPKPDVRSEVSVVHERPDGAKERDEASRKRGR